MAGPGAGNPVLTTRVGERVRRITLNRPHKRNALDRQARQALREAFEECRDASVIVLTGAGGTFCAGMDLTQLATRSRADEDELNESWRAVQEVIRHHPAIVIASVAGYALGGGATLINVCDLAVVAEDARIGTPEIGFGFYPGLAGPAAQLRLSAKRAAWMVLTADRIDGRTAVDWGMANLAVPAAELEERTTELARRIAGFDPVALEWSKKALWQIPMHIGEWRAALEFGAYVNAEIHARTASHVQALDGFLGGVRHPGQGADQ
jgi:enoyl-CoA hydratase/carnithine racemase